MTGAASRTVAGPLNPLGEACLGALAEGPLKLGKRRQFEDAKGNTFGAATVRALAGRDFATVAGDRVVITEAGAAYRARKYGRLA